MGLLLPVENSIEHMVVFVKRVIERMFDFWDKNLTTNGGDVGSLD